MVSRSLAVLFEIENPEHYSRSFLAVLMDFVNEEFLDGVSNDGLFLLSKHGRSTELPRGHTQHSLPSHGDHVTKHALESYKR